MSYDTMKLSVVQNPNGTYDLAVGLFAHEKRGFYREYQKEFSTYGEAKDYANERAVAYQTTINFHECNIKVVCDHEVSEYRCSRSEKAVSPEDSLNTAPDSTGDKCTKNDSTRVSARAKVLMSHPGKNRKAFPSTYFGKSQNPAIRHAYVKDPAFSYCDPSWLCACMIAAWQNWWLRKRWTQKPSYLGNGTCQQIHRKSK